MQKSSKKNQGWIFFLTLPYFKNTMQKKLTFGFPSMVFAASAPIPWFEFTYSSNSFLHLTYFWSSVAKKNKADTKLIE